MHAGLKTRLSIMMFLQYAIWGAWAPILTLHLLSLHDFTRPGANTGWLIALVYMTMAIASMVAPVAGQFADRYFSTERYLAFSHAVAGGLIIWVYYLETFWAIFGVMLLHTLLYAPTVGLTNSISMHHLPNSERDFGKVRLWGTIGWIVIAWVFAVWLGLADGVIEMISPKWRDALSGWRQELPRLYKPQVGHTLLAAGGLSFLLAVFCLTLPHTPPSRKAENPFAFLGAVKLMKNPSFAVLIVVAFLVSTELQFYYVFTPSYFNQGGGPFTAKDIAAALSKQRETQASYDASELVRQWDEKRLVLWDQRTLTREELDGLHKGLKDALLKTVYATRDLRDAEDLVYMGDAKELGGNGDDKLSRTEFARLKNFKSRDIETLVAVVEEQLSAERRKWESAGEAERSERRQRIAYLEKRRQTILQLWLSDLVERRRAAVEPHVDFNPMQPLLGVQKGLAFAREQSELFEQIVALQITLAAFQNQAETLAEAAAIAGAGAGFIHVLQEQRSELAAKTNVADDKKREELQLFDSRIAEIRKRLDRFDDRRPNAAKIAASAATALSQFDAVRDAKGGLALDQAWVGPIMTLGQIAEVFVLLLVPWSLKRLGFRITIAIGIFAWSLRYLLFSLGHPRELIIASQALHGFGFAFFFVGAFLYADSIATPDIRASVQSFIIFITYGAGMLVSSLIAGPVVDAFDGNWYLVFMVPAVITGLCTVAFIIGFKDPPREPEPPPKDPITAFFEQAELEKQRKQKNK